MLQQLQDKYKVLHSQWLQLKGKNYLSAYQQKKKQRICSDLDDLNYEVKRIKIKGKNEFYLSKVGQFTSDIYVYDDGLNHLTASGLVFEYIGNAVASFYTVYIDGNYYKARYIGDFKNDIFRLDTWDLQKYPISADSIMKIPHHCSPFTPILEKLSEARDAHNSNWEIDFNPDFVPYF